MNADSILSALGLGSAEAAWWPWVFGRGVDELGRARRAAEGFKRIPPMQDVGRDSILARDAAAGALRDIRQREGVAMDPYGMPHIWIDEAPAPPVKSLWEGAEPALDVMTGPKTLLEILSAHAPHTKATRRGSSLLGNFGNLDADLRWPLITVNRTLEAPAVSSVLTHEGTHLAGKIAGTGYGAPVEAMSDPIQILRALGGASEISPATLERLFDLRMDPAGLAHLKALPNYAFERAARKLESLTEHARYLQAGNEPIARANQGREAWTFIDRPWDQSASFRADSLYRPGDYGYMLVPPWRPGMPVLGEPGALGR